MDHRIYPCLPEYTPFATFVYVRPSQNLPLLPRIYPPFNNYMRPSDNLPLLPIIYPLFNNYIRSSQNLPLLPRIYPPFQQIYATLPGSTPPSQNIPPFSTSICDPPIIYRYLPEYTPSFSVTICDPPKIYPSLPEYTPLFNTYM